MFFCIPGPRCGPVRAGLGVWNVALSQVEGLGLRH